MPIGKKGSCLWCGNQCDSGGTLCSVCSSMWGNDASSSGPAVPEVPVTPARKKETPPPPVETVPVPRVRETPRILVIDDEPHICKLLESRLKVNGYEVITAANGADGLKQTLLMEPDLIIADIMMPKMTGYEFLKSLRAQDAPLRDTPVVIITAKHSMREFFDDWHIVSFVTKPFRPAELLDIIRKRLQQKAA